MDRELVVTWWNRGNATSPGVERKYSWPELVEWIDESGRTHTHPRDPDGKESLRYPCWSPAEYTGKRRSLATFERAHVVGLDFDDGAVAWEALRDGMQRLGFAALTYSTKSHSDASPSWRVLWPLAEPVNAAGYRRLRDWLNAELGGAADQAARDPSRYWWQPAKPYEAEYWSRAWPGKWVSLADVPEPAQPELATAPTMPAPAGATKRPSTAPLTTVQPQRIPPARSQASKPTAEPPSGEPSVLSVRRANRMLAKLSSLVAEAKEGTREEALRRAAGLIGGKPAVVAVLGREAILSTLVRAAVQAGLPEAEAKEKAARLFEWGEARPLPLSGSEQAEQDRISLPDRDDGGKPKGTLRNTMAVVTAKRYAGMFSWDDMAGELRRTRPVPGSAEKGAGQVLDHDVDALRLYIAQTYEFDPGKDHAWSAIGIAARANRVHPLRDWARGLVWDGTPRIDTMLPDYFGCTVQEGERSPNSAERLAQAARVLMLSAIARVEQPGCKADITVVFHGAQALKKSTTFAALAGPDWFSDAHLDFHDNQGSAMAIRGKWIVELSELSALRGRDMETVKAFLTRTVDRYREPYARAVRDVPRQGIFVGTSNDRQPFSDKTGNRRFFSVFAIERADDTVIRLKRDQLWAEAYARWKSGERWWLEADEEEAAALVQEQFSAPDGDSAWVAAIAEFLINPKLRDFTTKTLLEGALGLEKGRMYKAEEMRAARIMALHFPEWKRTRASVHGKQQSLYVRGQNHDHKT